MAVLDFNTKNDWSNKKQTTRKVNQEFGVSTFLS